MILASLMNLSKNALCFHVALKGQYHENFPKFLCKLRLIYEGTLADAQKWLLNNKRNTSIHSPEVGTNQNH